MHENQNNWQRIESVVKWANMTTNYFARYIGLSRGENLYQIKRGHNGISRKLGERIVQHFPQIDLLWLLTGRGQMFVSGSEDRGAQIPFFNADVEKSIRGVELLSPDGYVVLPMGDDADCALYYYGRAMGDTLPAGTLVFLKESDVESVIPGGMYVVVTRKIVTLRQLHLEAGAQSVRLTASCEAGFDEMVVKNKDIQKIYRVKAHLIVDCTTCFPVSQTDRTRLAVRSTISNSFGRITVRRDLPETHEVRPKAAAVLHGELPIGSCEPKMDIWAIIEIRIVRSCCRRLSSVRWSRESS